MQQKSIEQRFGLQLSRLLQHSPDVIFTGSQLQHVVTCAGAAQSCCPALVGLLYIAATKRSMMLPWQCALVGRAATHVAHSQASPVMADALGSINHRAQRCPGAGRTVASKAKLPPKRSGDL